MVFTFTYVFAGNILEICCPTPAVLTIQLLKFSRRSLKILVQTCRERNFLHIFTRQKSR